MAIDWPTATLQAIRRVTSRSGSAFFTRRELISKELDQIARDTQTQGATPHQTLSRILQELRDDGQLRFLGRGDYEFLQFRVASPVVPTIQASTPPADDYHGRIEAGESSTVEEAAPLIAIDIGEPAPPDRANVTVNRIIRNTTIVAELKALYDHRCQICGFTIELPGGRFYCEAHHIRPLGSPHDGIDIASNIIIVCPNHHAMLDFGAIPIRTGSLQLTRHEIDDESIEYHDTHVHKTG